MSTPSQGIFYEAGRRLSPEHAEAAKTLIPQQMDLELFRNNCNHRDPRWVDVFAYGLFPKEDPDKQVILQGWFARHEAAYRPDAPPRVEAFGFDIAYSSDGDESCLAAGGSDGLTKLFLWREPDAMKTIDNALRIAKENYGIDLRKCQHPVCVDCDGAGYIVANRMRELGVYVIEYHGSARAEVAPESYGNMRAEGYALLGRRLSPDDLWNDKPWAMPTDDLLREELCAPEKMYQGNDNLRYFITPKSRNPDKENVVCVREKIHRSPDRGDAVVYLWHAIRALHDFNEWLRQTQRRLVVYPAPVDRLPPDPAEYKAGEDAKAALPGDDPLTAGLRAQYGDLLQQTEKKDPPDWVPIYRNEAIEEQERNRQAKLAAEGKPVEPAEPPAWHQTIWRDQD